MKLEQKKKLLADVRKAARAVGQILDGPCTPAINDAFGKANAATLHNECLSALCGLCILEARLVAEIGTDNL
jgi:hypothetical protein